MSLVTWHNVIQVGLFGISCFGVWLTGHNLRWGWWFAIANQFLMWLPYAVLTRQWGLVGMSFVYAELYRRNLRKWRNTRSTPKPVSETVEA